MRNNGLRLAGLSAPGIVDSDDKTIDPEIITGVGGPPDDESIVCRAALEGILPEPLLIGAMRAQPASNTVRNGAYCPFIEE